MSQRYLLGTNICVHFLKGEFDIQARVQKVGLVNYFLSEIVDVAVAVIRLVDHIEIHGGTLKMRAA
jgi:hypothetical protein